MNCKAPKRPCIPDENIVVTQLMQDEARAKMIYNGVPLLGKNVEPNNWVPQYWYPRDYYSTIKLENVAMMFDMRIQPTACQETVPICSTETGANWDQQPEDKSALYIYSSTGLCKVDFLFYMCLFVRFPFSRRYKFLNVDN